MHNFIPILWIVAIGYLFGFQNGQRSTCQPGTFLGRALLIIIALVVLTFIFKITFGIHWVILS